jgi:hypothetical protein
MYVISACCTFLRNSLLPFQCTIEELEQDNIIAPELHALMEKLGNKVSKRKEDVDEKGSISLKKDPLAFYDRYFKHLEKLINFSDNYLYKIQFL